MKHLSTKESQQALAALDRDTIIFPLLDKAEKLTMDEAKKRGYTRMTSGYKHQERWMMENVLRDLERSGRRYAVVPSDPLNNEIWKAPQWR